MPGTAFPIAGVGKSRHKALQDSEIGKPDRPAINPAVISTVSHKFPKTKHLLKHADFQRVYQNGRRQFTGNMTVFFLRRSDDAETPGGPRVGFTVGKVVGGSVERNRIRRRMREAVRNAWQSLQGPVDIVFNPRRSILTVAYADVANEVARGLQLAMQRARTAQAESVAQSDAGKNAKRSAKRKV